jgi:hypothetical protein
MTFLFNLWQIGRSAPQIIGIVKAIIDVIGSKQVQSILDSIREALKTETHSNVIPTSEPERERLVRRILRRMNNESRERNEMERPD